MDIVKIGTRQMLAASNPDVTFDRNGSVGAAEVDGRGYDFDDED